MSWTNTTADYQNKVLESLTSLAGEAYDEDTGGDPVLANAYLAAADELALWINTDHQSDPFALWLASHQDELTSFAGRTVAIHLDKGVVANGETETFWDGSFRKQVLLAFQDDPKIFLTVVPPKVEEDEEVVEATEQQ